LRRMRKETRKMRVLPIFERGSMGRFWTNGWEENMVPRERK
jgi:hypothetical protein